MSQPNPPRTPTLNWTIAGVLLAIGIIAAWWVPIFARATPMLGDFPFFYWYLLLVMPFMMIICGGAYLLVRPRSGAAAGPGAEAGGEPR